MVEFKTKIPLDNPIAQGVKRLLDLILVVSTIPIWLPIIGIIALLIWLKDKHAPFYIHKRIGKGGKLISVIKFRTMIHNAESVLKDYLSKDPLLKAEWEQNFKLKNDPRVTIIGRWLRKSSLDELPQLFNVLKGDMSLVGPRPIVKEEVPRYGDVFNLYIKVYPGITGLWQVSGRTDCNYSERVSMDAFYIKNWSILLDLLILIRTIIVVLKRKGAY
ncbi:sugar transferase [Candidatus Kryptobacter tengchongensis]|uniref:sugar transferase n=1 Tax=Kryptobacter tengchongensis TaxID=1643429 RepID=UPI0007074D76|nr:sugar transferase [Candidatus Kryptobacter tengchongensis]CUS78047.1 Undecaprenyl-phosphate galactose phosphotransferase, WbaP [Candidatus Kryptobacter tengchongensis]